MSQLSSEFKSLWPLAPLALAFTRFGVPCFNGQKSYPARLLSKDTVLPSTRGKRTKAGWLCEAGILRGMLGMQYLFDFA
jgi:hypothetical protein